MAYRQIIINAIEKPKQLFLVDALGALLSAFLLGVVLVKLESLFGIPKSALYFLAALPCFFALYDFFCYFTPIKNVLFHLKVIALINLLYCVISFGLAVLHKESILLLGWIYIFVEIVIVLFIAKIEYGTASMLEKSS